MYNPNDAARYSTDQNGPADRATCVIRKSALRVLSSMTMSWDRLRTLPASKNNPAASLVPFTSKYCSLTPFTSALASTAP